MPALTVAGIPSSLRKNAYSTGLLGAAVEVAPADLKITTVDTSQFPLFIQDNEARPPADVRAFNEQVRTADAVLFALNEHEYSISAALKNAIDWGARPYLENVWTGIPAGLLSSSISRIGGLRAKYQLRQMFDWLNVFPINQPEVSIPFAPRGSTRPASWWTKRAGN
ncbi:MAG: NAD(P)H-dependent oxidoreductase [Thermoplasmata archaeon]|nr:NAD(P)H-dependent oxidoreductase [Thermoplasmata archaeon]